MLYAVCVCVCEYEYECEYECACICLMNETNRIVRASPFQTCRPIRMLPFRPHRSGWNARLSLCDSLSRIRFNPWRRKAVKKSASQVVTRQPKVDVEVRLSPLLAESVCARPLRHTHTRTHTYGTRHSEWHTISQSLSLSASAPGLC